MSLFSEKVDRAGGEVISDLSELSLHVKSLT
jgi:hypothetical protein